MVLMLLIGVAVGGVAGFSVGRTRSQEEARQPYGSNAANGGDVDSLAEQLDAARLEISQLETSRAQLRAQLDASNTSANVPRHRPKPNVRNKPGTCRSKAA